MNARGGGGIQARKNADERATAASVARDRANNARDRANAQERAARRALTPVAPPC